MTHHLFFESLEAFLEAADQSVMYAMPIVRTHPSQYVALVYSNIHVSQIHPDDLVHHVILKVAERTEPDTQERKQEQNDRLDTLYQELCAHLIRKGHIVQKAIVGYPKDLWVVESYCPSERALRGKCPVCGCNNCYESHEGEDYIPD